MSPEWSTVFVADLHCENGHAFEGWFASSDELASQKERGLLSCPVCGSHEVSRRPSATRLNVSALKADRLGLARQGEAGMAAAAPATVGEVGPSQVAPHAAKAEEAPQTQQALATLQTMYWQAVRHVMANTEDVGERFVQEVREMHQGEAPARPVRGQASPEDREALREEGIEVMSLPIPADLKGTLQ